MSLKVPTYKEFRDFIEAYDCLDGHMNLSPASYGRMCPTKYIHRIVFDDLGPGTGNMEVNINSETGEVLSDESMTESMERELAAIKKSLKGLTAYSFFKENNKINNGIKKLFKNFDLYDKRDFDKEKSVVSLELHRHEFYAGLAYCYAEYLSDLELQLYPIHYSSFPKKYSEAEEVLQGIVLDTADLITHIEQTGDQVERLSNLRDLLNDAQVKLDSLKWIDRENDRLPEKMLVARLSYNLLTWRELYNTAPLKDYFLGEQEAPINKLDKKLLDSIKSVVTSVNESVSKLPKSEGKFNQVCATVRLCAQAIANSEFVNVERPARDVNKDYLSDSTVKRTFTRIKKEYFE